MTTPDKTHEVQRLISMFPAVFGRPHELPESLEWAPLTGYLHVSGTEKPITNVHGHYIGPKEEVPVIHDHKGGRRAHSHKEGDRRQR